MTVMIGVDPHKRTHTAVVIDDDEIPLAKLQVRAGRTQLEELLDWSAGFGERVWEIESANGLGYLLGQQLVGAGEHVLDVPATLSARCGSCDVAVEQERPQRRVSSVVIAGASCAARCRSAGRGSSSGAEAAGETPQRPRAAP